MFLQSNGLPLQDYTNTKSLTMATSSLTPKEEIKHLKRNIKIYADILIITNWWNIFKIRHDQKMIKSYQKRIREIESSL